MPVELTEGDREILAELQHRFDRQIGDAIDPIRHELKLLGMRSSRPPGSASVEITALSAPGGALSRQLVGASSFQSWLKNVESSRDLLRRRSENAVVEQSRYAHHGTVAD